MTVNISKNIRKALFEVEKTALFIVLMVVSINLIINGLVTFFDSSTTTLYFIQQLLLNSFIFGFVYLIIYAINNVITSVPFLLSLNSPGKLLAQNIIFTGLIRSIFITLLVLLVKSVVYGSWFATGPLAMSIFGVSLAANNIRSLLLLAVLIYLALNFIYSLVTLISLLGVRYGWEYVLSVIFIVLGSFFLAFKAIVLFFVFGWQLGIFTFLLFILNVVLSLLNYRLIKNFEYKY